MKNKLNIYAMAIVMGIAIISMVSCSKEDQDHMKTSGIITKYTVTQDQVESSIINFNKSMVNHEQGFKSDAELPLGEALWLTEAGVNYEFRAEKEHIKNMQTAEFNTTIAVSLNSNNEYMVLESDVYTVYDNLLGFTANQIGENQVLIVSDVEIGTIENGEADIILTAQCATLIPNPYLINATDYWYPVMNLGKCDNYTGQEVGKDASWRINQILNATQYLATYWTDIVIIDLIYPNGEDPPFFWEGLESDCLNPSEMNHWRGRAQEVVANNAPSSDHHRISVEFTWTVIVGSPDDWYLHGFDNIKYGIPHMGILPPNGN